MRLFLLDFKFQYGCLKIICCFVYKNKLERTLSSCDRRALLICAHAFGMLAYGLAHPLGAHLGDWRRRYFRIKTNKRICKIIFRFPFHWDQSLQSSFQKICACGYRMAATQKNPWVRARHDRKQKQWRRYEINFRETVQKVAWLRIDTILSIWNIKAKKTKREMEGETLLKV